MPYANLTDTTVGDLERFGLGAQVVRFTCPVKIFTPDKEEKQVLTLDYVCTDATTRTYTQQTGSSSTAGETLPAGLAAAILAQRGGDLMAEEITIRLGDSFPTLGDADIQDGQTLYLQSFEVDCYDLTAQLHFGRPAFLSPEDMRDLLLGFRQRGFASNVPNRGEPDADDNMEDVGGVQPLKSSSIVVSSIEKSTVKGSGNAGNKITLDTTSSKAAIKIKKTGSGTITLDVSEVGSGKEAKFRDIAYTDSNGDSQTVRVLAVDDKEEPSSTADEEDVEDPYDPEEPWDPSDPWNPDEPVDPENPDTPDGNGGSGGSGGGGGCNGWSEELGGAGGDPGLDNGGDDCNILNGW
jgi:hypothetical protein